ncbi:hypothetical protein BVIR_2906 [Blastochloris viridis]|uniref:Uncharacterized protein n=1 Tax=Blastochloris viridis TaxID=1079 RepID=A0A0H5BE50_BLAVI|nr:hypothetical protein BVIR_2906 [Blastochloris viridis]BAR99369.1 hypothetical protein BV133_1776 [Blastochloris viridis]CUU43332.1 hypothetical protein BVIRIDIS_23510 [Blastochloris viridis]
MLPAAGTLTQGLRSAAALLWPMPQRRAGRAHEGSTGVRATM